MHWSDEELEELQYSSTEHEQHFLQKVKHQTIELQDLYWKLQSSALVTQHNTTYDELVWASDIVRSRALAIASPGGWLSRKSITAAAFAGQVLLKLPFFGQFQFTPQCRFPACAAWSCLSVLEAFLREQTHKAVWN
ncbi:hypothetical protein ABBQ32_001630 [Trebouxia sp. C0010 RCD-2024]